jgi:uncharacterized membrane protein
MEGVESIKQIDERRTHWRTDFGLKNKEFDAEIVEQVPDRKIAWRSVGRPHHGGMVTFLPLDEGRTRVDLTMDYEPEGFIEKVGDAMGIADSRVMRDLDRFKEFIEGRGQETGAWRGEIKH